MSYLGDFAPGTAIDLKFTTTNTTGVAAGYVSGGVAIWKNNSVTSFTTGATLTTAFASTVGLNHVRIVTTNLTNFPVAGATNYMVSLSTGTVSGNRLKGYVIAHFSTRNRVLGADAINSTAIKTAALTSAKFGSGAVTATVINTGALTAAKFGASAVTGTVLSTTAAVKIHTSVNAGTVGTSIAAILDDTGTSGVAIAAGAISTTKFAAGAIDAAAIATDAIGAAELAAGAATEIADAVLDRDMSTGTDSGSTTVRTVRQAMYAIRNKVAISGTTMTVTKTDDSTTSWTAVVATTAGNPISSIDPAGP
jgi:hypothetical protein